MLPKNSYLRLADNDFYNIEKNKKFIYSKLHESAAEILSFIFRQLQSRTPDLMEYLNFKEENSLICAHCKNSRIIYEFEAPILNININDINNMKDINSAIKGMLEYEIESVARKYKDHQNMGIDFISSKYSVYINEFFIPDTPYNLKGFIAYERFGRRTGHYVTYIRYEDKCHWLNDSQKSKKIDEKELPTERSTVFLYEMK